MIANTAVAMTRPKRSLTVIGDSETVKRYVYSLADSFCTLFLCLLTPHRGGPFLKSWMEFLEDNADLRYPDASAVSAAS